MIGTKEGRGIKSMFKKGLGRMRKLPVPLVPIVNRLKFFGKIKNNVFKKFICIMLQTTIRL